MLLNMLAAGQIFLAQEAPTAVRPLRKIVARGIICAVVVFVLALAAWLYRSFPEWRRAICQTCIVAGFAGMLPCVFFGMFASEELKNSYWAVAVLATGGVGLLSVLVGFKLLGRIGDASQS